MCRQNVQATQVLSVHRSHEVQDRAETNSRGHTVPITNRQMHKSLIMYHTSRKTNRHGATYQDTYLTMYRKIKVCATPV